LLTASPEDIADHIFDLASDGNATMRDIEAFAYLVYAQRPDIASSLANDINTAAKQMRARFGADAGPVPGRLDAAAKVLRFGHL
jgi:hypothetical protein